MRGQPDYWRLAGGVAQSVVKLRKKYARVSFTQEVHKL